MTVTSLLHVHHLAPPQYPEFVATPRKPHSMEMPILVCTLDSEAWYENSKLSWEIVGLVRWLKHNWPENSNRKKLKLMLVCRNPHKITVGLHRVFSETDGWQIGIVEHNDHQFFVDGKVQPRKAQLERDLTVKFFGWREYEGRTNRYIYPVTPDAFMKDFSLYRTDLPTELLKLYAFGRELSKWIRDNELRFNPSRGGLAAQLLRDSRFYPDARRKVPKLTNEKSRPALPGNYYRIRDRRKGKLYSKVLVIDQQNAHHFAASTVKLPNANTLFARGRFLKMEDKPFARDGSVLFDRLISEHGLLRVCAIIPRYLQGFLPPWAERHGVHHFYLYSNEIELAKQLGIDIRSVSYGWTSPETDSGLAKFAQWAQDEVITHPRQKVWLKPTLLSVYGILATRPRKIAVAHYCTPAGEPYPYFFAGHRIVLKRTETKRELQSVVANVIHRGMIEAETRRLGIELARTLTKQGYVVIGVHADAVMVLDEGQQLPLLPPPWRVKETLTGYRALDAVRFMSNEFDCLPGTKRHRL